MLARDTATNTDTVLEIQHAAVDVDDERVEKMISESVDHAFEDMNERIWTEAKLKSDELLGAVEEAMPMFAGELSADEMTQIQTYAGAVKSISVSEIHDAKALKSANQALDDATQTLAVLLVERAMEEALERKLG